jgi:hypothetical protein
MPMRPFQDVAALGGGQRTAEPRFVRRSDTHLRRRRRRRRRYRSPSFRSVATWPTRAVPVLSPPSERKAAQLGSAASIPEKQRGAQDAARRRLPFSKRRRESSRRRRRSRGARRGRLAAGAASRRREPRAAPAPPEAPRKASEGAAARRGARRGARDLRGKGAGASANMLYRLPFQSPSKRRPVGKDPGDDDGDGPAYRPHRHPGGAARLPYRGPTAATAGRPAGPPPAARAPGAGGCGGGGAPVRAPGGPRREAQAWEQGPRTAPPAIRRRRRAAAARATPRPGLPGTAARSSGRVRGRDPPARRPGRPDGRRRLERRGPRRRPAASDPRRQRPLDRFCDPPLGGSAAAQGVAVPRRQEPPGASRRLGASRPAPRRRQANPFLSSETSPAEGPQDRSESSEMRQRSRVFSTLQVLTTHACITLRILRRGRRASSRRAGRIRRIPTCPRRLRRQGTVLFF